MLHESGFATREPSELERFVNNYSGPELFKWQHYLPIYERHLRHLRGQSARLVEIGVAGGGSLRMWRSYLGPNAQIIGVDVEPACSAHQAEGITVEVGDQGEAAFWQRFVVKHAPFDAVIDDGSHLSGDQLTTLQALLPRLRPGGVYICEDIHGVTNPFTRFIDGLARNLDVWRPLHVSDDDALVEPGALQRAVAAVHHYPFMVVIERTTRPVQSFSSEKRGYVAHIANN